MNEITLETKGEYVKILINGLVHLSFKSKDLYGIHALIDRYKIYQINIHLTNGVITSEYDDKELLMAILKKLELVLQ